MDYYNENKLRNNQVMQGLSSLLLLDAPEESEGKSVLRFDYRHTKYHWIAHVTRQHNNKNYLEIERFYRTKCHENDSKSKEKESKIEQLLQERQAMDSDAQKLKGECEELEKLYVENATNLTELHKTKSKMEDCVYKIELRRGTQDEQH